MVRNDHQFDDVRSDGAEPVLCDLESASDDDIDAAQSDSDLVVFTAGAGPDSGRERKLTLDRDGAIASVESAVRIGARRFVIISSTGADDPPDDDETFSVYLRAKADADDVVRSAGVDGIIVRPGRLIDDDPTGTAQIGCEVISAVYSPVVSSTSSVPPVAAGQWLRPSSSSASVGHAPPSLAMSRRVGSRSRCEQTFGTVPCSTVGPATTSGTRTELPRAGQGVSQAVAFAGR